MLTPFPKGKFRFFALDVETANSGRGSICQIGIACVHHDNSIETWATYVNPETEIWLWSGLHGITPETVEKAPTFTEVLSIIGDALKSCVVYQHSAFDSSAIAAACKNANLTTPTWQWQDSVKVARQAWPELRQNGGHGLANLKAHLGLNFNHHDAGEDARAAAQIVILAEQKLAAPKHIAPQEEKSFESNLKPMPAIQAAFTKTCRLIGISYVTQGNINNSHIYIKDFIEKFPEDTVGGSNLSCAAKRKITLDWGGAAVTITDIDGTKKLFRKRSWVREFFEKNNAMIGDKIIFEEISPYNYRVSFQS